MADSTQMTRRGSLKIQRLWQVTRRWTATRLLMLGGLVVGIGGCNLAPTYHRPTVETAPAFKELGHSDQATNSWKQAQPRDNSARGRWWEMFENSELNALEDQVSVSNQTVATAYANYLSARALVREAHAQLYPTLTANPDVTRSRQAFSSSRAGTIPGSATIGDYLLPLDASWQPDFWGRVRNNVKANTFEAQAAAADVQNTRLAAQAELAADYFQLRAQDALVQLYGDTVRAYQESYNLTKVRFQTGIASDEDVAQAETQLESARAQQTNLEILRHQLEHAIAILTGRPPEAISLANRPLSTSPPEAPTGIPSELLERRPDIAAAERRVAEANARIGIAKAAYYPNVTLSASAGLQSSTLSGLLRWSTRAWSVGAGLAETIFDAGLRRATVEQSRAAYDATVGTYRQTVLTAFQQVEDNLAALKLLATQVEQQNTAVESAQRYLNLANDRYKLGIDSYLNVITAQTTYLVNRQTLVNLKTQQMLASVHLVQTIGGGWDNSQLPSSKQLLSRSH